MSGLLKRELEREFAELEKSKSSFGGKRSTNKKLTDKLPTNRHGIKKNLKRLKEENSRPKFGNSAKKFKFSFLELESKKNSDEKDQAKVEAGVEKLLRMSKSSGSSSVVFEQHDKLNRHYIPKSRNFMEKFAKKKKKEPEGTVFTEEDFEKFAKEYFVNSKPVNSTTLVSKPRFDE